MPNIKPIYTTLFVFIISWFCCIVLFFLFVKHKTEDTTFTKGMVEKIEWKDKTNRKLASLSIKLAQNDTIYKLYDINSSTPEIIIKYLNLAETDYITLQTDERDIHGIYNETKATQLSPFQSWMTARQKVNNLPMILFSLIPFVVSFLFARRSYENFPKGFTFEHLLTIGGLLILFGSFISLILFLFLFLLFDIYSWFNIHSFILFPLQGAFLIFILAIFRQYYKAYKRNQKLAQYKYKKPTKRKTYKVKPNRKNNMIHNNFKSKQKRSPKLNRRKRK